MEKSLSNKYINEISSNDLLELIFCFHSILDIGNRIIHYPIINKIKFNERKHDSSYIIHKTLLHGYSIKKLLRGISAPNPINNNQLQFTDPLSIIVLCRSLLESYLTFNHINYAKSEDEKDIRFNIWIQYGLRQRVKIGNSQYYPNDKKSVVIIERDKEHIAEITEKIQQSAIYEELDIKSRVSFDKKIKKEWKIAFYNKSYVFLSWQKLLENTGMNQKLTAEVYNFLSWYAHTTCISIYQMKRMIEDGCIDLFIVNTLKYSSFFIAMAISDIIRFDECYQKAFNTLSQESKILVNTYNSFLRGNDYIVEDENFN